LIFMDIRMPKMDGYEAAREIMQWEQEKNKESTPIVALTAHVLTEDIKRTEKFGFNDHFTKPIKKDKLIDLIERYTFSSN